MQMPSEHTEAIQYHKKANHTHNKIFHIYSLKKQNSKNENVEKLEPSDKVVEKE